MIRHQRQRFTAWLCEAFYFGLLVSVLAASTAIAQTTQLTLGQSIERELAGGQTHQYELALTAGQYIQLTLKPLQTDGFDVVAEVFAPDGTSLATTPATHSAGRSRSLSFITAVAGNYRISLQASALSSTQAGRYEIKLAESRLATQNDHGRLAAEKAEDAALSAGTQVNIAVQTFRIAKLKEALAYWQQLGDSKGQLRILGLLARNCFLRGDHKIP